MGRKVEKPLIWLYAALAATLLLAYPAQAVNSFQKGMQAARAGKLEDAIKLWSSSIARDPKFYAAYVNRGSAYLLTGHVMKGVLDWHKAKLYGPIFAYGLYGGDFVESSDGGRMLNYAKSLEIDPDYITSVSMAGITYLDLGKDRLAIDLYRKSIELTRNPVLKNDLDFWIKSIEESTD